MAWRASPWPWLLQSDRGEAERRVTVAIFQAGGVVKDVAKLLEVSTRSAFYLIEELKLAPEVARARSLRRKPPSPTRRRRRVGSSR
jgi:hypothetical protein